MVLPEVVDDALLERPQAARRVVVDRDAVPRMNDLRETVTRPLLL